MSKTIKFWNNQEEAMLLAIVEGAKDVQSGLKLASMKLERSFNAVAARYAKLKGIAKIVDRKPKNRPNVSKEETPKRAEKVAPAKAASLKIQIENGTVIIGNSKIAGTFTLELE